MKLTDLGLPSRALKALAKKGITTAEELTGYIEDHPGWCHSDAYPNNICGIGEATAREILVRLRECGIADDKWCEGQTLLVTHEGYASLWTHVGRTRKRLNVKSL